MSLTSSLPLPSAILQQGGPSQRLDLTLGNQWPKLEGCWGPLPEHSIWVPWARDPHDPAPADSSPEALCPATTSGMCLVTQSCLTLCVIARQAPLSMSGLPLRPPGDQP